MTDAQAGNSSNDPVSSPHGLPDGEATVVLSLDGLEEHAFFAGGCCAVTAADAIESEMRSWPFVQHVVVDDRAGVLTLSVTRGDADIEAIMEALESMGYAATIRTSG